MLADTEELSERVGILCTKMDVVHEAIWRMQGSARFQPSGRKVMIANAGTTAATTTVSGISAKPTISALDAADQGRPVRDGVMIILKAAPYRWKTGLSGHVFNLGLAPSVAPAATRRCALLATRTSGAGQPEVSGKGRP